MKRYLILILYPILTALGILLTSMSTGGILIWPSLVLVALCCTFSKEKEHRNMLFVSIVTTAIAAYLFLPENFLPYGYVPFFLDFAIALISLTVIKGVISPIFSDDIRLYYLHTAIVLVLLTALAALYSFIFSVSMEPNRLAWLIRIMIVSIFLLLSIVPLCLVIGLKVEYGSIQVFNILILSIALASTISIYYYLPKQDLFLIIMLLVSYNIVWKLPSKQAAIVVLFFSLIFAGYSLFLNPSPDVAVGNISICTALVVMYLIVAAQKNELNNALTVMRESKAEVEREINRQVEFYRELNDKLIYEIEAKGLIEAELRKSKTLLGDVESVLYLGIWEFESQKNLIRFSENALKMLNLSTDQNELNWSSLVSQLQIEDRNAVEESVANALNLNIDINLTVGVLVNVEKKYFKITGRVFDKKNGSKQIIGLFTDISDVWYFEKVAKEKEALYRAIFESNIDPVFYISIPDYLIVDVNPAFESVYGWEKVDIVGKPVSILVDSRDKFTLILNNTLKKGYSKLIATTHIKKSGEDFWVEGTLVKIDLSEKSFIFAIVRDVTFRRNAEFRLAEREQKYRIFFESNLMGMAEVSMFKEWISFNTRLANMLGYRSEELKLTTWDRLTIPEDLEYEQKLFSEIIQRKRDSYTLEKRFIRKDGRVVFCNVSVSVVKTLQGSISSLVMLVEDISLKKEAELLAFENQKKMERAQDIADLGICIIPQNSPIMLLTDKAISILGWSENDRPFYYNKFLDQLNPLDREKFIMAMDSVWLNENRSETLNTTFIWKGHEPVSLRMSLGKNYNSLSRQPETIISFVDITKIKKAEIALREANLMKDQLFSVIAHDLRSPLGGVSQLLNIYINEFDTLNSETRAETLGLMQKSLKESEILLENLLEWARSQQNEPKFEILNVDAEIEGILNLFNTLLLSKSIQLDKQIDRECSIFADRRMFRTIARNLISNAIKFTNSGGKIVIIAFKQKESIVVEFTDNGVGMGPDVISRVLNEQDVYSTPGTADEKGTGLGLKLVQQFVKKSNGILTITSKPGEGTTFRLTFPLP